jgi:hypothetical protein
MPSHEQGCVPPQLACESTALLALTCLFCPTGYWV